MYCAKFDGIMKIVYIDKKRSGPRTDPWGTPYFTSVYSESKLFTDVY